MIISPEMPPQQIARRVLAMQMAVPDGSIRKGRLSYFAVQKARKLIHEPISIEGGWICFVEFFVNREARKQPHSALRTKSEGSAKHLALRTKSEGSMAPQILMRVGPHSNECHKGPQEATPGTRPPATPTLGRRPQLNGQPTTARTLVPARSVKSTPLRIPEGPRRGCAAGQHAQHFGLFVPRCRNSPTT